MAPSKPKWAQYLSVSFRVEVRHCARAVSLNGDQSRGVVIGVAGRAFAPPIWKKSFLNYLTIFQNGSSFLHILIVSLTSRWFFCIFWMVVRIFFKSIFKICLYGSFLIKLFLLDQTWHDDCPPKKAVKATNAWPRTVLRWHSQFWIFLVRFKSTVKNSGKSIYPTLLVKLSIETLDNIYVHFSLGKVHINWKENTSIWIAYLF